jgi:hypothetical protein
VSLAAAAGAAAAAARILEDMGVLKELMDNNEAHFADAGAQRILCPNRLDVEFLGCSVSARS